MVCPSTSPLVNAGNLLDNGDLRRQGSALGSLFRGRGHKTSSVRWAKHCATMENETGNSGIAVLDHLSNKTLATSSSTSSCSSMGTLPEDLSTSEALPSSSPKSCLKYKTQVVSLQNVYVQKHNKIDQRTVDIGAIIIYLHGICLGDNPAVSNGPPITVEWAAFDSVTIDSVQEYENHRVAPQRMGQELALSSKLREDMLLRSGFVSRFDVAQAIRAASLIRTARQISARRYQVDGPWKRLVLKWRRMSP